MSMCPFSCRFRHASPWKCLARFFLILVPLSFGIAGASGVLSQELGGHAGTINAVAFSPDGRYLATGGSDAVVKLWDLGAATVVHTWTEHLDGVASLDFSPDGSRLASGGADGLVLIRDVEARSVLLKLEHEGPVTCVRFAPDGRILATGVGNEFVRLWELQAGRAADDLSIPQWLDSVKQYLPPLSLSPTLTLEFTPDGKMLAAISPGSSVNIIKHGKIIKKLRLNIPPRIYNLPGLSCINPDCIANYTHYEGTECPFIRYNNENSNLVCDYCGKKHSFKEIWR